MSFGNSFDDDSTSMSEINMTPLVDVMLVLLIIFIITIPVINHGVKIDLPRANSQPEHTRHGDINLTIDADGGIFWNSQAVQMAELSERMEHAARQNPQPELHLHAERRTPY